MKVLFCIIKGANMSNVTIAFLLTLFAGLSTGIGSLIILFVKKDSKKFLSLSLGFSAGVMVYLSMMELLAESNESLISSFGKTKGSLLAIAAFFGGILLILLVEHLIPEANNPHETSTAEEMALHKDKIDKKSAKAKAEIYKAGILTAIMTAVHNFPEGFVTFVTALYEPKLGVAVAIAIALHNIPEGISIAVPIYYTTGSKQKAFLYSFVSGLAEPVGALLAYLVFGSALNEVAFGLIFGVVAGIMTYISLDKLLPTARDHGEHHFSLYGLIAGMLVMALSLIVI